MIDPWADFGGHVGRTVRESTPWWPAPTRPEPGSPNVVLVLIDDMGFSDIGAVRLRDRHPDARPPRRARRALHQLPHDAAVLAVARRDPDRAEPPSRRVRRRRQLRPRLPRLDHGDRPDVATLPEVLRAPRATPRTPSASGTSPATPRCTTARPSARGRSSEGSTGSTASSRAGRTCTIPTGWSRDNSPVDVDAYPDGYYFTDDITDEAISYLKSLRAHDASARSSSTSPTARCTARCRPSPTTSSGIAAGTTTGGTRSARTLRAAAGARAVPRRARPCRPATPRRATRCCRGTTYSADEQALFARYMEVYAAMVDNVDQNLARLLDTIEALGRARQHHRGVHLRQRRHRGGWRRRARAATSSSSAAPACSPAGSATCPRPRPDRRAAHARALPPRLGHGVEHARSGSTSRRPTPAACACR